MNKTKKPETNKQNDFVLVKELENKYYMPCFSRQNICVAYGEGARLFDSSGKEYIDFTAGIAVNSLGYAHPELCQAIANQAQRLIHISNLFYTKEQSVLAEKLLKDSDFERVFFCNSGAEANEAAIKLIKKHFFKSGNKKTKIIAALNSFHGRTMGSLSATGQPKYSAPFAPLLEGFVFVPYNDIGALKDALDDQTAAVLLEPIQGESGVIPADYDYLVTAYALAKAKGALFVLDEIQTGMGRTGKMFCYEHYGIKPDIITLAKGIAGGVPMGAVLARGEAATAFLAGDHGSTFGGNPLACAAAMVVTTLLKDSDLLCQIADKGEYLHNKLAPFRKYKFVTDIRGKGLLQALQLSPKINAAEVVRNATAAGFLINCCGNNTLRFMPPYIIQYSEIDLMVQTLGELLDKYNV